LNAARVDNVGVHWRAEALYFSSGDVELAGTLRLPAGAEARSAVALVHGSGWQTRDGPFGGYLRAIAEYFASAGVAALAYDKRGCGESSGDWETATFEDLAADASGAVDLLRSTWGFDRVGLWGSSQAGWILPLVATRRDLATVIVVSGAGCGVTPAEQDLYWRRRVLIERGVDDETISLVLDAWRGFFRAITTGDRSEFDSASTRARARASGADLPPDPSADDPRAWYRNLDVAFDALPLWQRVRCPVLAVFGERDLSTPTPVVAPRLRDALRTVAGSEIVVLPDVGHTMLVEEQGTDFDSLRVGTFAPAFLALMEDWIQRWLARRGADAAPQEKP
jgi:pimeloyl-ACP methyl ester carboxylesterase